MSSFFIAVFAVSCYTCQPSNANMAVSLSKGNLSGLDLCNNPTDSLDCCRDPDMAGHADSCYKASVTLKANMSHINMTNIDQFTYHILDCAVKSKCSQLKNLICRTTSIQRMFPDFKLSQCDVSCCEEGLCNNPSGPSPAANPLTTSVKRRCKNPLALQGISSSDTYLLSTLTSAKGASLRIILSLTAMTYMNFVWSGGWMEDWSRLSPTGLRMRLQ